MATRACVFLVVLLLSPSIAPEAPKRLIVWNVGQGLWTTGVDDHCWHFDMGGERAPWGQIMDLCRRRRNLVHLSHWDSDHINFLGRANFWLPNLCRMGRPLGTASTKKITMVERVRACPHSPPLARWQPLNPKSSNEASAVIAWHGVVNPGDSSQAAEAYWAHQLPGIRHTRVLLLGHHGSRTSTSRELLRQMPLLRMSVASARRRRYGHPHSQVEQLLRLHRVPLLLTEDWGHLHFWLD